MKKLLNLFLFIVLINIVSCKNNGDNNSSVLTKVDTIPKQGPNGNMLSIHTKELNTMSGKMKLLKYFFVPFKFIHDTAIWIPDKDAEFNLNVSGDGYCHTNIDTIIKTPPLDISGDTLYLVLFTTCKVDLNGYPDGYSGGVTNYGIAKIELNGDKAPDISYFKRCFASTGDLGLLCSDAVGLQKLADGLYAFYMADGYTHVGQHNGTCVYYNLIDFNTLFSYEPYIELHDGATGDSEKTASTIVFDDSKNKGWYDKIKMKTQYYHFDEKKNRYVTDITHSVYQWNENEYRYEPLATKNNVIDK
jgi:hypothetical protein